MEKLPSWATRVVAGPTVRQAEQAQHWDDRKSQSRGVMRRICPRRSGRTWREQVWNRFNREEQMMSDANRLVRPGVVAQWSTTQNGCISVSPSGLGSQRGVARLPAGLRAAGPPLRETPSLGLSRVKGNFHARFLRGGASESRSRLPDSTSGHAKKQFPISSVQIHRINIHRQRDVLRQRQRPGD